MSGLLKCGICCMLISIWGIIQLFLMGIFYYIESVTLIEDVEADEYDDYDDFIKTTTSNYNKAAINCWIATAIYVLTLILSYMCIVKAKRRAKKEALQQEDDEFACTPKDIPETKPKKIK